MSIKKKLTIRGTHKRSRVKRKSRQHNGFITSVYVEARLWDKINRLGKRNNMSNNAVVRHILSSYRGS